MYHLTAPNYPNNANCRWNIEVASDQVCTCRVLMYMLSSELAVCVKNVKVIT